MDALTQFFQTDWKGWIIGLVVLFSLGGFLTGLFEKTVGRLGLETKAMRRKREDRELLKETADELSRLREREKGDSALSLSEDKKITETLGDFMDEMRGELKRFGEKQIEISSKVNEIIANNEIRDNAMREQLSDRIQQRARYYIDTLKGIPSDEVDEFAKLYASYSALGGNHGAKAKYDYCMHNLRIIPKEELRGTEKQKKRRFRN